jgi:2-methylcitrate dehydratase PrpD
VATTNAEQLLATLVSDGVDVDGQATDLATAALLDTLAIGIAGMHEPTTRAVRSIVTELSQEGGVATWSGSQRYSVTDVALLHGTACHSLDWDDFMHPMHGHCSSVLLPTLWGLAEQGGRSGADLVDAYLVGYQVDYLVSLVLSHGHYRRGWHATSTIGAIGAAAAASRLLGLDADQAGAALGIAASEASGLQVNFGTPTKGLHAGLAARSGVLAAHLARAGMTSSRAWLTGQHGMLSAFGGDAESADAASLVADGMRAAHGITTGWGLVQKPYSSCGCSHAMVDAILAVREGLAVDDVTRIEVHVDPAVTRTMREIVPTDPYDARYSVSWVAAVALADGAVGPQQFTTDSIARDDVRALRERVVVMSDLEVGDHDRFAARVVVRAASDTREVMVHHAQGHPQNPMDAAQRRSKQVRALTGIVRDPKALVDRLQELPSVADVTVIGDAVRAAR